MMANISSSYQLKPLHMASCMDELIRITELAKVSKHGNLEQHIKRLANSLPVLAKELREADVDRDEEKYYVYGSRYFRAYREVFEKKNLLGKEKDQKWWNSLPNVRKVVEKLEWLTSSLDSRYEALNKKQSALDAPSVSDKTSANGDAPQRLEGKYPKHHSVQIKLVSPDSGIHLENGRKEITDLQLCNILKRHQNTTLIIDVRESANFKMSHIRAENCINVPVRELQPLTAANIEAKLDGRSRESWRNVSTFDTVVIVDALGKPMEESKPVIHLVSLITEYSTKPCKRHPLILLGGFYDFLERYPMHVTDADAVLQQKRQSGSPDFSDISKVSFPSVRSISIFGNRRDSLSAISEPQPIPGSYRQLPAFGGLISEEVFCTERKAQPIQQQQPKIQIQTEPVMPSVNRALKPSQLLNQNQIFGPASEKRERDIPIILTPNLERARGFLTENTEKEPLPNNTISRRSASPYSTEKREKGSRPSSLISVNDEIPSVPNGDPVRRSASNSFNGDRGQTHNIPIVREDGTEIPPQNLQPKISVSKPLPQPPVKPASTLNGSQSSPTLQRPSGVNGVPIPAQQPDTRRRGFDIDPSPNADGQSKNGMVKQPDVPRPPVTTAPPTVNRVVKPTMSPALPPPPSHEEWSPFEKGFVEPGCTGLRNLGNTCYMNAMLQCLSFTSPLRRYFLYGEYKRDVNVRNVRGPKGYIAVYMERLMGLLWSGDYVYISPKFMKKILSHLHDMFDGYDQQDAHSALVLFIEFLLEDTNTAPLSIADDEERRLATRIENSDNLSPSALAVETMKRHKRITNSVVDDVLSFMTESVITCSVCRFESCTFHMDQMINLWLGPDSGSVDLRDLMNTAMKPLDEDAVIHDWKCPKCRQNRMAVQRHYFHSTPQILIILLKRFSENCTKDTKFVNFPEEISVEDHCRSVARNQSAYRLYAVLDHYGQLDTGHYTATVRHPKLSRWVKMDDQKASVGLNFRNVVSSQAYVLFYERCE